MIANGFDDKLDELRNLTSNAAEYLRSLESREKDRTGIGTLKVGYNRVHGYFIEVSIPELNPSATFAVKKSKLNGSSELAWKESLTC